MYDSGVKDLIISGYNGEYIESNQKYAGTDSVEFTEQYSIHFPVRHIYIDDINNEYLIQLKYRTIVYESRDFTTKIIILTRKE